MRILYTGKPQSFTEAEQKKINARLAKISKMVDGKGEKEVHAFFQIQRHIVKAEVTLRYYGHSAVGAATNADAFRALTGAFEKLEKQVVKLRAKWRDTKRTPAVKKLASKTEAPPEVERSAPSVKRVRVDHKPMTVDEAVLVIGGSTPYLPFHDAETGGVSVLIRSGDGKFDLIET